VIQQFFEAGSFIRDAEYQRGRAEARLKHKTTRIVRLFISSFVKIVFNRAFNSFKLSWDQHEMELENPVFAKLAAVTAPAVADTPAAPAVLIDPFASKTATPDVEWWDVPLLPQGASAYSGTAVRFQLHFIEDHVCSCAQFDMCCISTWPMPLPASFSTRVRWPR
jgi:hypothetical protein